MSLWFSDLSICLRKWADRAGSLVMPVHLIFRRFKTYNWGDTEGLPGYYSHDFPCVNVESTCQYHIMDIGLYLVLQTSPGLCTPILACCTSPRTFATHASFSNAVTDTSLRFRYILRLHQAGSETYI